MNEQKDAKVIQTVIIELLRDIRAHECRVWLHNKTFRITYVDKNGDEITINELFLQGTKLCTPNGVLVDLNNPGSLDVLKAELGMDYDIYGPKRWKALVKLPLSVTKYFWRVRRALDLEIREWLNGRFTKDLTKKD